MIKDRLKKACVTNDIQISSVTMLTAINIIVCISVHAPKSLYIFMILFYPVLAFIANLIDPIPKEKNERNN